MTIAEPEPEIVPYIFLLADQTARCRRLAAGTIDVVTQAMLLKMAAEYEAELAEMAEMRADSL